MKLISLSEFEQRRSIGETNIIAVYDEERKISYYAVVDEDEKDLSNKSLLEHFYKCLNYGFGTVNIRKYWEKTEF